jgi:hypothetical protein
MTAVLKAPTSHALPCPLLQRRRSPVRRRTAPPTHPPSSTPSRTLAGHPLAPAPEPSDVGAGTGIATALLHARGAEVIAIEPGAGMARQFRRTLPDVPIVRGNGNALPFADASADFLTYAQAWHWTDPAKVGPGGDARTASGRRPGAVVEHGAPWTSRGSPHRSNRVARSTSASSAPSARRAAPQPAPRGPSPARSPSRTSRITRSAGPAASPSTHTSPTSAATRSSSSLGEEGTASFLAEEREHLLEVFPDGIVEETYDVDLLVALRP